MPAARLATLKALAEATVADPNLFHAMGNIEETVERLRTIRGVGEWTAQYIALRAIREMDAFPATDIGLLRGAAVLGKAAAKTVFCIAPSRGGRGEPMRRNTSGPPIQHYLRRKEKIYE